LFIVSRQIEDADEVVWLVSDYHSEAIDARKWLTGPVPLLGKLSPETFKHPERLSWGVYHGMKAEGESGGGLPRKHIIAELHGGIGWAVWPTKLTLAPGASGDLVGRIAGLPLEPSPWSSPPREWEHMREPVRIAQERWKMPEHTALMEWNQFRRRHELPEDILR
jgi:hypothetical protein